MLCGCSEKSWLWLGFPHHTATKSLQGLCLDLVCAGASVLLHLTAAEATLIDLRWFDSVIVPL